MRAEIYCILDARKSLHFCRDINGIPREADIWFRIEDSKEIFVNIEQILVRLGEANNVTSIEKVVDMPNGVADYKVIYNKKLEGIEDGRK